MQEQSMFDYVCETADGMGADFFSFCYKGKARQLVAVIFSGMEEQHTATMWMDYENKETPITHEYHGHARHLRDQKLGKVKCDNYRKIWNTQRKRKEWTYYR